MNVTQFLQRMSYGPLSNIAAGNNGDGTIKEDRVPTLVTYLNEALLRLYTRFDLREKEVIIEQLEAVTSYQINSQHSLSYFATHPEAVAFIQDSIADPFVDDLIKILAVYDANACKLPLNDDHACNSLFTPQFDTLQVPSPITGSPLYIIYQARHLELSPDALDTEIALPAVLEEAAISYVASKIYSAMNGQEHRIKAMDHMGNYEAVCNEVEDRDLVNSSLSFSHQKLDQRGFV